MRYVPKRPKLDPCPVEEVLDIVSGKWKTRIILLLHLEYATFSDIRRAMPGITQQVLSAQLAALVKDGVVSKTVDAKGAGGTRYALTEDGRKLLPLLKPIGRWGLERLAQRGQSWTPPPRIDGRPVDAASLGLIPKAKASEPATPAKGPARA